MALPFPLSVSQPSALLPFSRDELYGQLGVPAAMLCFSFSNLIMTSYDHCTHQSISASAMLSHWARPSLTWDIILHITGCTWSSPTSCCWHSPSRVLFCFVCICICSAPCVFECVHVEAWCDTGRFLHRSLPYSLRWVSHLIPDLANTTGLTHRLVPGISHLCLLRAGITRRLPCLCGASTVLKIPTLTLAHVASALPAGPSLQPFCRWWRAKFVIVGCSKCLCVNNKHEDLILHLFSILGRQ